MQFIKVKTRKVLPPKDEIYDILDKLKLKDGDIAVITSKILAIHQGRTVKIDTKVDKNKLIQSEAEYVALHPTNSKHKFVFTIKHHTIIASAGIDESNAKGHYILWPKDTNKLLKQFWSYLKRKHGLKKLGLIATDSHITPLRRGISGISIGFFGFEPLKDYRKTPDIFGRKLKVTVANLVEPLAAMAVLLMGEGSEQTPIVIIRGFKTRFTNKATYRKTVMPLKDDLYYPILRGFMKSRKV
ncbi:MAG: coenzyme F420-0:L-glutamate ligase [Candidatus Doudnabacteria bacterium]|nr:coenzyme F420-0:L-glutamate ligase [Candidatus Doudnabacteria bacterium]